MRLSILTVVGWLLGGAVHAQPQPCEVNAMTSTCLDACVVCDIDGFTGTNDLSIQGQTFPEFCTTIFHNMSYIAFIAGTPDLTLTVTVTNCTIGRGVEIGIFESLDCENFTPVTDCNTDVAPNGTATFSNLVPLVVGQHYYLILDGSMGDVCDWTFNVVEGSTVVGDLTTSGIVEGPTELCPELSATYATTGEEGATLFYWTLDGVPQSSVDEQIQITYPADGTYELCVTAANVCDQAPPSCTAITVVTPTPTYITEELCATECFEVAGESICETGNYLYSITLPDGCDSLIYVDLTISPEATTSLDISLCIGDRITIGDASYSSTGMHTELIQTDAGCDSIVTLNLTMIDCEISGISDFISPICHGAQDGSLLFTLDNGTPPFTYTWRSIVNTTLHGDGTTSLFEDILIENIPAGFYEVYVNDDFGNDVVFIQEVTEPAPLVAVLESSDYNGYEVSCHDGADGSVVVSASGGAAPYTYEWTTSETTSHIADLIAGSYGVSVTDALGCVAPASAVLSQPEKLNISTHCVDPRCEGLATGAIQLDSIWGGVSPYMYSLDGEPYVIQKSFEGLSAGSYLYSVRDANGCLTDTVSTLQEIDIPELFMPEDQEVDLGCTVTLTAETNTTSLTDIQWTDVSNSVDCTSCLTTDALPVSDTKYMLSVTSEDDCTTEDSTYVRVRKIRDVYSPNAFSPNDDGLNDYFTLIPGKSVLSIRRINVYDRWGSLVYGSTDIVPNSAREGWDGYCNGRKVVSGVYVWTAEVEYIDGIVLTLKGDVTVFL